MAPINSGYSRAAQKLKLHCIRIIRKISQPLSSGTCADLSLSSFSIRLDDLWNALLKEKFVFSFKNTLEIIAYKAMEEVFYKWDGKIQRHISEWEERAENEIASEPLESLQDLLDAKVKDLSVSLTKVYDEIKSDMEVFFSGRHSEMLSRWKGSFEFRFETLVYEVRNSAFHHCSRLCKRRETIRDFETDKKKNIELIQQQVQMHIDKISKEQEELLNSSKSHLLTEEQLTYLLGRNYSVTII